MSQENVEVVQRWINAFNCRDLEAMSMQTHRDLEVDWSASRGVDAGVYRGLRRTEEFAETWFDLFHQVRLEPERFIASGDSVCVPNSAVMRGRDGIETVARSCLIYELRGGRILRICLYQETRQALEAVGLSE